MFTFNTSQFSRTILTMASVATIALMVVGVFGNSLTIIALAKRSKIRTMAAAFIVSLCIADLLFCFTVLPFSASHFLHGTWVHGDLLCSLIPFLRYGNVGVSLLSVAMISINRYVLIAWPHLYPRIYTRCTVAFFIAFCWLFSYGMQLPTLLGIWGEFGYDARLGTCTIKKDEHGRSSKTALFIIAFIVPCLIIIVCYAKIFLVVKKSHARVQRHTSRTTSEGKRSEWSVTKMVLAIFLGFLICYLPITLVKVADENVTYPGFHITGYLMLFLSACINPIIYVTMNKQYRQAYRDALICKSNSPQQNTDLPSRTLMSVVFVPNRPNQQAVMQIKTNNNSVILN
ncbi:G-protein coupled receptor moody isoform X2 [Chrysoperla carnea]|uniref:G-protein coupled receptor moody isoform X2 n=1 Tax=Chrysoperla carnea TaxID=189513 RepID=UPI001D07A157|nr:G-protein coupled receptor moody isoform X2 [Chrysoperla carnea]